MKRTALTTGLAAVSVLALVAAGCGDDNDEDTSDDSEIPVESSETSDEQSSVPADWDPTEYCEASLALETAPEPEIDWESASPDEQAAAVQQHAVETMQPFVDEVVALAPETVGQEIDLMTGAFAEVVETGDYSAFDQPDVAVAGEALHGFDVDQCGWTTVEVETTDYAFEGLPTELEAGVTSFELTNDGGEVHELALARKNDGVTATAEELVALPEDEAMAQVTLIDGTAFAPPGEEAYLVADLEPGDYVAVCFVPTGMTSDDGPPPEDAPPHAVHGMVSELTVS